MITIKNEELVRELIIDGFIGDLSVSIKPMTYKTKNALPENIVAKIIFYKKTKFGLEIDADAILTIKNANKT